GHPACRCGRRTRRARPPAAARWPRPAPRRPRAWRGPARRRPAVRTPPPAPTGRPAPAARPRGRRRGCARTTGRVRAAARRVRARRARRDAPPTGRGCGRRRCAPTPRRTDRASASSSLALGPIADHRRGRRVGSAGGMPGITALEPEIEAEIEVEIVEDEILLRPVRFVVLVVLVVEVVAVRAGGVGGRRRARPRGVARRERATQHAADGTGARARADRRTLLTVAAARPRPALLGVARTRAEGIPAEMAGVRARAGNRASIGGDAHFRPVALAIPAGAGAGGPGDRAGAGGWGHRRGARAGSR